MICYAGIRDFKLNILVVKHVLWTFKKASIDNMIKKNLMEREARIY